MTETRNRRRVLQGIVVSDQMKDTISVRVERRYKHRLYGKFVRAHKKYLAHDEGNTANVGDVVQIMECRPMSKRKRYRLTQVVEAVDQTPNVVAPETVMEGAVEQGGES